MNFRRVVVLSVALTAQASVMAADFVDRVLTLEDSVRLALNNSPAILSSREDVNIALQRVREAQSLFYPRLDLNANWSKFGVQDATPLMLQPALGPTLVPANDRENFYTARANIYQSVYEGGRSRNLYKQARISFERSKSSNESMQTQVAAAAKQAFYDLLFAQERKIALQSLLKMSDALEGKMSGSLTDQLRLESEMSAVRSHASQAAQSEHDAHRAYLLALNLELNTTVALKGTLETHPVDLDLSKLLAWSTQYRSELRQTEFQQEIDALGVGLSQAERRPTIGFGASYERTGNDIDLPTANWAGTLNVNLPVSVSDIVYGWAKVRERKALYRQATIKHAEVSDLVQRQVRQGYDQYLFWQSELGPRQESLRRVEDLYARIEKQQSRSSDRLEAARIVTEARLRYLEAVHGHLSSMATLERAVGKPLNEER